LTKYPNFTHRRSRTPIVELEKDTLWNVELNASAALNRVNARFDTARLTNRIRPDFAVNFDRSTLATVVIHHCEIGVSILRRSG